MGKYRVIISRTAKHEIIKHKKSGDQSSIKKLEKMLKELEIHPYVGVGKPKRLKNNLAGLWSRRINKKDRLVYEVKDKIVTVYVLSAIGHYDDK